MSVKYPNYVNLTSSSEEQPNERTPSPPLRKKSLSPPQAPSKFVSSKSTHYTSSSSPRNITINRVYYVKGLNHNLFLVGQFCDADLEVAFWKSTYFVRDLQGNDLLTVSKAKRSSFKTKAIPSFKGWLNLLHMDLCGPMRFASINGKKYILVIIDDYSRYTWTLFLRSKDETPEALKDFLTMIQQNIQALVISVRTDKGTEFLNKTLHAFFKEEGIEHQTSTPRTPEQNGVVERRNRTLVEAARTMLSTSKLPLFF
ncbi:retrovirus-related pol polyprotein from transposon TNT 1-94 [Tanacetum coccineum]|uniref:Retrovirus-related pol polyprotein from transposon TNT 1-94 n=1 Tax=Tanacetum coccineum TaxID=301880 RepID=A0ABQ4YF73_9ASTR